jgi:hypothetical protein
MIFFQVNFQVQLEKYDFFLYKEMIFFFQQFFN